KRASPRSWSHARSPARPSACGSSTFVTELSQTCDDLRASVVDMDEAERVLARLELIESLDPDTVPASRLLGELRALVREAEAWARVEGDRRDRSALLNLQRGAEGMS